MKDASYNKAKTDSTKPLSGTWNSPIQGQKEWWLPGAWGGENGKLLFNGYRSSVLQEEKTRGDGCW